ncbi:MAG: DUF3861 family protein [Candidatus Amulumruptor caecigallinarius]|nr:DUF3861 family protein [Candidatus Amulumruptor caecigallinarius]
MDCNKQERSYQFTVTEQMNGENKKVMDFHFGGHHDLVGMTAKATEKLNIPEEYARELVLGMRLLHHALKKNEGNADFTAFLGQLDDFKHKLNLCEPCK